MSNLTLDQMVDHAVSHARNVLIGHADQQLTPIFHFQFKSRPDAIMAAPWTNDNEKHAFLAAVRSAIAQFRFDVVSYSILSEAWAAFEDPNHPVGLMPRDREDRREVVMITAADGVETRWKSLQIVRDDKGRVTDLVDEKNEISSMAGAFHNLFEDEQ